MYNSTVSTDSTDIVLFADKKLIQITSAIKTYRITGLSYETRKVTKE
ncbi:hypothetical protein [Lentilactobacillus hilgardii]